MTHVADNEQSGSGGAKGGRGRSTEDDRASGRGAAWKKSLRAVAPYLDLGWRLAGTAAFPPLLGYLLDQWLQTTPGFLLGGCVFGLAGAVLQLVRLQGSIGR